MKKLLFIPVALSVLMACKKPVSNLETTPTLDVEQKNMGVYAVRTATWCWACGTSMEALHNTWELNKETTVGMAFKDAFSGEFGAHSDWGNHLFSVVAGQFEISTNTPTNFQNFNYNSVSEHTSSPVVIVNGNYEIDFDGNDMTIRTTSKFFTEYTGDIYLAPFIIVDDLVGYQNDHPDSPNTVHKRYVADVAVPINKSAEDDKHEWGYLISAGDVKREHTVNMTFKATKKAHWANNKISIGMVYFRKVGNQFFFINAFTKY